MTDELRAKMEKLRAIAPRLNKATEDSASAVIAADDFLRELGTGITVHTSPFEDPPYQTVDDTLMAHSWHLAYGRLYGNFCVHVLHTTQTLRDVSNGPDGTWDDAEERISWSNCPRAMKLKAVTKLPELLEQITQEATVLIENAEKATAVVRETMEAIGRPVEPIDERYMGIPPKHRDAVSFGEEKPQQDDRTWIPVERQPAMLPPAPPAIPPVVKPSETLPRRRR